MKPADLAAVCLLGGGLLAAGWRDGQTLGHDRKRDYPGFDLLHLRDQVQRVGGAEMRFRDGKFLMADGLSNIEDPAGGTFRHGLGPATRLTLRAEDAREVVVELRFFNGVAHQDLTFRYDGQVLEELHDQPKDLVERTFQLPLGPGEQHVFQLEYARWNHHGDDSVPGDDRPLAGPFDRLRVEFR